MLRNGLKALGACVLVSAALGLWAPAGAQPPNPELTRILDLMEQRQKQAGIIRIKAEGTRFVPKGARSERLQTIDSAKTSIDPAADETTELRQDMTFDFTRCRYKHNHSERLGKSFDAWTAVFDGDKTYGAKPDLPIDELDNCTPSAMSVVSGAEKANIYTSDWWPYLLSSGFIITNRRQPYYLTNFALPIDREAVYLHSSCRIDGTQCAIIRMFPFGPKGRERFYEYVVGRDDGAVRLMTDWAAGQQKSIEITLKYRTTDRGVVLSGWTHKWMHTNNKVWQTDTMRVMHSDKGEHLSDRFALRPAPGALVRERKYDKDIQVINEQDERVVHYKVDGNGHWVKGEVVNGNFVPNGNWAYWISGVVTLLVLLSFICWRMYSKSGSTDK